MGLAEALDGEAEKLGGRGLHRGWNPEETVPNEITAFHRTFAFSAEGS